MNALFILIPIIIYIINEYHQNKIFNCFANIYRHRKFIMLITPLILVYLRPDILKKIMIFFKDIDDSPMYQDLDTMMSSYVNIRNQRKYNDRKLNIPSNNQVRNRNFQNTYQKRQQANMSQQINPNANTGSTNINLIKNPGNTKHKRNVSESKKKFIASNQKWKCSHCQNLLDNTYEVDHITALYKGGSNELNNLEALCRNCHGKKTFMEKMGI
jgi:5-methylcytosine-specific restriction endonuclease McrA